MKPKRILAVIITYYPEKDLLDRNIRAFISKVDKVLIWENTPSLNVMNFRFFEHEKIEYCGDGVNSISRALNYAWKYAQNNGYDYLLTMDQDSVWEDFGVFLDQTIYSSNAPEGIWTPLVVEQNITDDYVEISQPITSGMLIKTELLNKIGGWNEFFEIDSVDDDFIIRAHRKDIKAYIVKGSRLRQTFGEPEIRTILGRIIVLRNYSSRRLYNIFRNNIILIRMYPEAIYIRQNFKNSWLRYMKFILLFEKRKITKFIAIIKGIIAGIQYKIV